jgi:putative sterol carrier protein
MAEQPSLDNIPGSFAGLQAAFVPDRARGVDKTIQFNFTGREAGSWVLIVRDGTMAYRQGTAEKPDITVTVDSDDWLKILRGELNPMTAVMSGRLKLAGDMGIMLQFQGWFARPS